MVHTIVCAFSLLGLLMCIVAAYFVITSKKSLSDMFLLLMCVLGATIVFLGIFLYSFEPSIDFLKK
jgi:hypothetical protein